MTGPSDSNLRGILLMVLAMAAFAIADALIKLAADTMSPAHTALLLLGGGLVIFAVVAVTQGHGLADRRALSPVLWVRYLSEIVGTLGMVQALALVPLSTVGAILQVTPLVVVAGAVLILKERVSWRRWSAICIGFLGMLMIVQPGTDGFDASVLWPILSMLGLSVRDLTTRMIPRDIPSASLATYTMIAALPTAILWCLTTEQTLFPTQINWIYTVGMISFGAVGYLLITAAMRSGDMSVVAPFRYVRLIFLLILGMVIFAERPDGSMLAGAALIIASGIYAMWRDRQTRLRAMNAVSE